MTQNPKWNVVIQSNLNEVESAWQALYSGQSASIFQHFSLQKIFFETLHENGLAETFVAVVYVETGAVAAIIPFTRSKQGRLTWIKSADEGMLDVCQPILSPELVTSTNISSLMRTLKQALPAADVVYFNKLPAVLGSQDNKMLALSDIALLPVSKWTIDLSEGYEAHHSSRMSKKFRSVLRNSIRRTEKKYVRNFELFVGDEVTGEVYQRIEKMRAAYFEREGRRNHLEDSNWSLFYERMATDDKGSLKSWVCFLSFDDQPAAAILGLMEGDYIVCLIVATNTHDFAVYSPGAQLSENVMRLFELRGVRTVDWSIGDWDYKRRLGANQIRLYDFMMPKSIAGQVYFVFWRVKSWLRNTKYRETLQKIRSLLLRR